MTPGPKWLLCTGGRDHLWRDDRTSNHPDGTRTRYRTCRMCGATGALRYSSLPYDPRPRWRHLYTRVEGHRA